MDRASSESRWPDLPSEAFHGLPGDIVHAIEPHSEADPVAILIQLLVAFGNVVGRKPHFIVEADRHGMNLFCALVGATSKARKGTSWGHVRRLFDPVDNEWVGQHIQSGLSSGEGLIYAVRDADEDGDPGVSDKRLLVMAPELASVLRVMSREGNTLSPTLRQGWDSGDLRVLTRNSPIKATGAHISLISHITGQELRRYMTTTEAGNGFANRFLWVSVQRSQLLPEGGDLAGMDLAPLERQLGEAVQFARSAEQMKRDDAARELWRSVYPKLSEGRPGLLGAVTSRAEAQVTRISCIFALLDQSTVVRRQHLEAALALWRYADNSVRYIWGDALGDPIADEILARLRATPEGLSRTQISDIVFKRHRRAVEIDGALRTLEEQGLAVRVVEETAGRPVERWFAVEHYQRREKSEISGLSSHNSRVDQA